MAEITVYSKPNCQACVNTKRWLDKRGIAYETGDLLDEGNLAAAKFLGHQQAPVIVTRDAHWSGFNPNQLELFKNRLPEGSK